MLMKNLCFSVQSEALVVVPTREMRARRGGGAVVAVTPYSVPIGPPTAEVTRHAYTLKRKPAQ